MRLKLTRSIVTHTLSLIIFIFFSAPIFAVEHVVLQLRWHHQFQFAGYYAALEKGYYQQAGLDVEIVEGQPDKKPIIEVLNGNANYGIGNSEVLLSRLEGSPLIALAAIFQHSPSVLISKRSSQISTPHDLIGKSLMMINEGIDADFIAMLNNEGINPNAINTLPSSYQIDDLITGKTDAFNAYLSNEPFYLEQQGIEYSILTPKTYGVDFYSDILFTSEHELTSHPERVALFREASLKGWQYALDNPDEIIDLLLNKYHVDKSKEHLAFEAKTITDLILPNVVEIGHMNPWRWQHMAETFIDANMSDNSNSNRLTGFDYHQILLNRQEDWSSIGKVTSVTTIISIITLLILYFAFRKTKREIRLRIKAEQALEQLAYTDNLTGLYNRHQFFILAEQTIKNAVRNQSSIAICFLDVNKFKEINDQFGHHIGDELLRNLATVLKTHTRHSDIIARIGGDEFVIILDKIKSREQADILITKLNEHINKPFFYQGESFSYSVSIGVSIFPDDAETLPELIKLADSKMYRQKQTA